MPPAISSAPPIPRFRLLLCLLTALLLLPVTALASENRVSESSPLGQLIATDKDIKVFKTPYCGCCNDWVTYMEQEGFTVEAVDVSQEQLNRLKYHGGLQPGMGSCHTAFIDGYLIEGHVPASDIRRLLDQQPDVAGLAVPGMPVGSPGMEMGDRFDAFDVITFDRSGQSEVFSRHNQN
ncbi:DUF411 domain-containing protein [Ectothiorhodospira sp. BSL-9]|uniref:DUF411 domain-containing protein n=1 Tax=Ectothiorhodospira sp. BSL-9 TaxID=1442136 RepID=UPI0009EDCCD5|nr:DUF411 domain-containing protein [Ectothiorhodospira sp. BSL-9]TVQ73687.1 MAG: DUF411 domain-containing protein [Chromatiaceae bacterium]